MKQNTLKLNTFATSINKWKTGKKNILWQNISPFYHCLTLSFNLTSNKKFTNTTYCVRRDDETEKQKFYSLILFVCACVYKSAYVFVTSLLSIPLLYCSMQEMNERRKKTSNNNLCLPRQK